MSSRPRIVFMGTPEFAVASLEACFDVGDVVAVVTQPDKPKGRGNAVTAPPVKERALEKGIPVLQPQKLRTPPFSEELRQYAPDVCVVTAYGKILPKDLLALPVKGCVNVHASLLPRFRGAAPIQWAIEHGDSETGVSLMVMDEGLDTGPVLAMKRLPIAPDETSATLHAKLSALGGDILRESLPRYLRGELTPQPQPSEGMVLAPIIDKENGKLDFAKSAVELDRRLRAFTPWPGAYTLLGGKVFKVHRMRPAEGKGAPGTVLSAGPEGIEVACGEGSLVLLEVQPEGKRVMRAADFLSGNRLQPGSQPFTS
ncbi:methionyl-tRNA formyltransferase [Corallococcus exiguus]|uniref:Methionyl-tRNA formyltransferase n=1 Tax=Corallococcus exiguus TaxID=83462 RepID=A0A7Y1S121_9BACT|nr:methionyl-tRNA formyltransferase [Corallococcus exiguus]MBN8469431.1 methionyl-tRNA formyltransferase [Corallococcus exiguus]NBC39372.1 methionyl-tRNA formyltransferase [Corallococcus exiguus]NNB86399.1 methionyl-tRNA formyltransferase [Corallococcus exiguus]NNB99550.1 methionyl-tRNA formyltransferase [Corallococcus exiguus]NNC15868.1 methionyl-tRNA formyltransferase [Corallococcus exiguus]